MIVKENKLDLMDNHLDIINAYFVKEYNFKGDFKYYLSKNSKFILTGTGDYFELTPNTENMNNKKIKKYHTLDKNKYGGDFRRLNENNLVKLIEDLYAE